MGGGGNDIRIRNRALVSATGNKTCNVGHIHHQHRANFMGNICKNLKVNGSGVSGGTGDEHVDAPGREGLVLVGTVVELGAARP